MPLNSWIRVLFTEPSDAERLARCYRILFHLDTRDDLDYWPAVDIAMARFDLEWAIEELEKRLTILEH